VRAAGAGANTARAAAGCSRLALTHARRSCQRCDGTGKLTCTKCRGPGFLRKGPNDNVKAFRSNDSDTANFYLCPFCKGTGTQPCPSCRGTAVLWPAQVNVHRLFKWKHVHEGALQRFTEARKAASKPAGPAEAKRKIQAGLGGFTMSGSANLLPYDAEPEDK